MTPRTIMVVDDELPVQRVLSRMLDAPARTVITADNGVKALALVAQCKPDLILLDVNMPQKNGWEVLGELRRSPGTRLIPVIMLTSAITAANKVAGLELGADDYMTKPFAAPELRARVEGLLRRHTLDLSANPLTGLPGNPAIAAEVSRRLREKEPFAFFYIDIDRFKAFNDSCGFAAGDHLLIETASLIRTCLGEDFVGHVGGDDFVAISGLEEAPHAAQRLACLFDERAPGFAHPALRRLPTLSIGIVTTQQHAFASYDEVAAVAAEMKAYLKAETGRTLSRFAFDRRGRS
jgi:diguanylate cyclase (GGDEF)-like protein